jgi:putative flippase GtrA
MALLRLHYHYWHRYAVVRFLFASGLAAMVDYGLYLLLARSMRPEWANMISVSVAIVFNFSLQRLVVFRNIRRSMLPSFVISITLSFAGMLLATLIIYLIRLGYPEGVLIPKLIATGLVFSWNYFTKKHLAFQDRAPDNTTT